MLADRREQRVEVGVASCDATSSASTLLSQIRCTGRPSRRSSLVSSSRPASIMSTRRSRQNHWRILLRARGDATNCSQSRDGPAVSTFDVKISHVSPLCSVVVERHEAAVDLGADAGVADLGVDGVGEVDAWSSRPAA